MPERSLALMDVAHSWEAGSAASFALRGVSLDLFPGQLQLVMGPSGSGKTTLLMVLGCLLRPALGRVELRGEDVTEIPEQARSALRRRNLGFVFQSFRLFRSLTALENVMLACQLSGRDDPEPRSRAIRVLESVGLGGKLDRRPRELSGGEKQRVAIARALVHDPPVLLADEPTASLDRASGLQIAALLRSAATEGRTVIAVTHDPRLAPFADRTIHLEDGRVVAEEARHAS